LAARVGLPVCRDVLRTSRAAPNPTLSANSNRPNSNELYDSTESANLSSCRSSLFGNCWRRGEVRSRSIFKFYLHSDVHVAEAHDASSAKSCGQPPTEVVGSPGLAMRTPLSRAERDVDQGIT